jgi:NAD(P) transhydrogenase
VAACRALDVPCRPVGKLLPFGIWTVPEIGMVGLTENAASEKGLDVEVGVAQYAETARGQIIGDVTGVLKLVVAKADGKLVGAHMTGTGAAELVHMAQMAIDFEATYLYFIRQVMNYPTLSRVYKVAAWDLFQKLGD